MYAGPRVAPARTCGRRTQRTVARAFPDALDLFVVTVQAGYPPLEAIASLRPLVHASIGDVFQVVLERSRGASGSATRWHPSPTRWDPAGPRSSTRSR
jgi:Flp pilus assembly protein TadB